MPETKDMTLRQRIGTALLGEKSFRNLTMQVLGVHLGSGDGQESKGFPAFAKAYETNADVHSVLQQISSNLAGIPVVVMNTAGDEPEPVEDTHPLRLLLKQPNPWEAYSDYVEHWVGDMYLGGRSFQKATITSMGDAREPSELVLLRPDKIEVKADRGASADSVLSFVLNPKAKDEQTFTSEEVLPIAFYSPDPAVLAGLSPLTAAMPGIAGGDAARTWNISLVQNKGMPSGVIGLPDGVLMNEESKQELRAGIEGKHAGPSNAGAIVVMDGGTTFKQMSMSPADMDWTAGLAMDLRDVAKVCKVPSLLVGDNEAKTYANFHEARVALYLEAILPLADRLLDNWNSWLAPKFGDDLLVALDLSNIEALSEDADALWKRVDAFTWMTPNEKRAAVGLPPYDDEMADVIWTPPNLLPLGLAQSTDEDNEDTASRALTDLTKLGDSESGNGKQLMPDVGVGSRVLPRLLQRGSVKRVGGSLLLFGNERQPHETLKA